VRFVETPLDGLLLVELDPFTDARGSLARTFDHDEFAARGLVTDFPQWSTSFNRDAGTLRGLHYQADPHGETKLVRCTRGAVFDVAVDLRPGSPTRGRWWGVELSADDARQLYIPIGFAHGFQTLVDGSEILYAMGARYRAEEQRGARWDDPAFAIDWPAPPEGRERVISDRDRAHPLQEATA
jgi:dTDP-4-dehydrorhamnose 3,5-epimerase